MITRERREKAAETTFSDFICLDYHFVGLFILREPFDSAFIVNQLDCYFFLTIYRIPTFLLALKM